MRGLCIHKGKLCFRLSVAAGEKTSGWWKATICVMTTQQQLIVLFECANTNIFFLIKSIKAFSYFLGRKRFFERITINRWNKYMEVWIQAKIKCTCFFFLNRKMFELKKCCYHRTGRQNKIRKMSRNKKKRLRWILECDIFVQLDNVSQQPNSELCENNSNGNPNSQHASKISIIFISYMKP